MSTTCMCVARDEIISPMASAMRPDTPVSISSNMIVGSLDFSASIAFRANITRDVSPPEATFSTGCGAIRPLAVNMKRTRSPPVASNSPAGSTITSKRASGMPNLTNMAATPDDTRCEALHRMSCMAAARSPASRRRASIFSRCAARASSPCCMRLNREARSSPTANNSSSVETWCF